MNRSLARLRRASLGAVVAVGLLMGIHQPAVANAATGYNGCKWSYGSANILLSPAAKYQGQVTGAANTWNRVNVSGKPRFQNISGSPVRGIEMLIYDYGNTGWDGLWSPSSCGGQVWASGTIKGNVYHYKKCALPIVQAVLIHEMGHALGLAHLPTNGRNCSPASIMSPNTSTRIRCRWTTPQPQDIAGLNNIYG